MRGILLELRLAFSWLSVLAYRQNCLKHSKLSRVVTWHVLLISRVATYQFSSDTCLYLSRVFVWHVLIPATCCIRVTICYVTRLVACHLLRVTFYLTRFVTWQVLLHISSYLIRVVTYHVFLWHVLIPPTCFFVSSFVTWHALLSVTCQASHVTWHVLLFGICHCRYPG